MAMAFRLRPHIGSSDQIGSARYILDELRSTADLPTIMQVESFRINLQRGHQA